MIDPIERRAAIDALEEPCKVSDTWTDEYAVGERVQWEMDVKALNSLPTIDAVEVVRCRDCLNFTRGEDEWGSCFENPLKMWRDTDYCSWGERKEDEKKTS